MHIYPIPGFEDPFSSLSHLFAVPVFLVWGILVIKRHGTTLTRWISLLILTMTTVFLLSMSGVYHLLGHGTARAVLKQLDIAGVFALIAGTATPIHAVVFKGVWRWAPLWTIWTVAVAGITLRSIYSESLPLAAGTAIFLVMGWGGLVTTWLVWREFGFRFARPLLEGGMAYSVGAAVIISHWPTMIPGIIGPHEIWHVAVLAGLTLHWLFILQCVKKMAELPVTADGEEGGVIDLESALLGHHDDQATQDENV